MVNGSEGSLPGLEYAIDRRPGMSCMICHAVDRSLLFRKDDPPAGICEPCTLAAHWAWRRFSGEIPPGFPGADLGRVSTVFALVARRREMTRLDAAPGDAEPTVLAPAELNSSWEFLLVDGGDGTFNPPSVTLDQQPDLRDQPRAALSALSGSGLISWSALAEPLFTGYSPRGRLVSVVLIRGWADLQSSTDHFPRSWKAWPLSAHTGPMAGFWRSMETVWSLRLHKHCVVEDNGELCVHLRDAACRYIELQLALRAGKASDSSMSLIYKSAMSVDELATERLIQLVSERARGDRSLAVIPREAETGRGASGSGRARRGSSVAPWDDPGDEPGPGGEGDRSDLDDPGEDKAPEAEFDDEEAGDLAQDGDGDNTSELEDRTFVRPGRPLKR